MVAKQAGQAPETPAAEAGAQAAEAAGGAAPEAKPFPATEQVTIQCAPYIETEAEDRSFRINGSEQGKDRIAFADRDIVYLNKGSNAGVKAGDMYTTHHRSYNVKHPPSGKTLGTKIETTGVARVILVEENSASVIVERACADMHAGDYLKPYEKASVPLVLRRPPADRLTRQL